MENQNDTAIYQKDNFSITKENPLNIKLFSDFAHKKTEKLTTALYMVSDCLEDSDPIKQKLRSNGVDLLSFTHRFAFVSDRELALELARAKGVVNEILSFINIASIMGHISDMNSDILRKQFGILESEITRFESQFISHKTSTPNPTFTPNAKLDENSFNVSLPVYEEPKKLVSNFWSKREDSKGHVKDTINTVLYKNDILIKPQQNKMTNKENVLLVKKEERETKLLQSIKDISQKFKKTEVSIKDISFLFKDFSEKTIQRDLNNLVALGKLKKEGNKRWSRYSIISST